MVCLKTLFIGTDAGHAVRCQKLFRKDVLVRSAARDHEATAQQRPYKQLGHT